MLITSPSTVTVPDGRYGALPPSRFKPEEISTPTADQLMKDGGTTWSGRERAVAQAFRYAERNVPTVELRHSSAYNSMAAQDAAAALDSMRQYDSITLKLDFGKRFVDTQGKRFNEIYQKLLDLRARAGTLQNAATYNLKRADASWRPGTVSATATSSAVTGTHGVTVTRLAKSQQLSSGVFADPAAALGYSGSFTINGWTTAVTPSDTLDTIRDKINYGEDTNHNGVLDKAADVNGDGALSTFSHTSGAFDGKRYMPPFYLNEAAGGFGNTPEEDTNGNEKLDGGSAGTGVKAAVTNGQLVLSSLDGANIELRLSDPNRILEGMGVLWRHPITYDVSPARLNWQAQDAQTALFAVDGAAQSSPENTATVGGLALTFNNTGTAKITVQDNPDQVLAPVADFGNSFNNAMQLMNRTIAGGGALTDNVRLQTIYSDTVRGFFTAPPSAKGGMNSVADLGVSTPSEPSAISQLLLENLPDIALDTAPAGTGPLSFFNQTARVGVNAPDNFTIAIDKNAIKKKISQSPTGAGEMLNYAASRLQANLDLHLNPDYGTIRLQQEVAAFYAKNQGEVVNLMTQTTGVAASAIAAAEQRTLFQNSGASPKGISVTA